MRYLTAALLGCLLALTSFAFALDVAPATPATCAGRGYGAAYSSRARLDS